MSTLPVQSLPTEQRSVWIVETDEDQRDAAFIAASRCRHQRQGRCVIPVTRGEVAGRIREVCASLGIAHELRDLQDDLLVPFGVCASAAGSGRSPGRGIPGPLRVRSTDGRWETLTSFDDHAALLAYGPLGLAEATRHAHLSGRPLLAVDGAERVDQAFIELRSARSVFVFPEPDLDVNQLLSVLHARRAAGNERPLGFLYPFGSFEREVFLLKSHLFATAARRPRGPYVFCYPLESSKSSFADDQVEVMLGRVAADDVVSSLQRPHEFLFATPHSNGVDMSLAGAVLCAREDRRAANPVPLRALPCFHGERCSRESAGNRRTAASEVRSAVVFMYTCWGVLLEGGSHHVSTSLGSRFAASAHVGALLSTFSMSYLDRAGGPYVASLYGSGMALGEAARRFNARHFERYRDHEEVVVLFGNPELRLSARGATDPLAAMRKNPAFRQFLSRAEVSLYDEEWAHRAEQPELAPLVPGVFRATEFARCTALSTCRLGLPALSPVFSALGTEADQLWLFAATFNARLKQSDRATLRTSSLRAQLLERLTAYQAAWEAAFAAMVGELGGFLRMQVDRFFSQAEHALPGSATCPYCKGPTREVTLALNGTEQLCRLQSECFNCATIRDGSERHMGGAIACTAEWRRGGTVHIDVSLRDVAPAWRLVVAGFLEPFVKRTGAKLASAGRAEVVNDCVTPGGALTAPGFPMVVPQDLERGLHHLNVLVLVDADVMVLRRPIYVD